MMNKLKAYLIRSVLPALIFGIGLMSAEAQTVVLQLQSDYTIGNATNSPRYAVGDVNNDRMPDLVTLNKATAISQPLSVFLNNGAGGFGAALSLTDTTISPNAVAIGDYNKDGNADLAIASDGISNGINIRLGNGTGNFASGASIAAERGSTAIISADFNSDGNLDVAICNNVNELRVLSGNGAGGFGAATPYATSNVCQDMTLADFNVDGKPDIAVSDRINGRVQTFLNNGAGIFNAPINTNVSGAYQMAAADFNRDCVPDLAVTQFSGSLVFILLGNGAGGFASTSTTVTNSPAYMTIGDFNRDKKIDLAVRRNTLTAGANNLTILPGDGAGAFGAAFELSLSVPTTAVEMRLASIDANMDGKTDIVIGRQGGFFLYNGNSALFTRTENDFDGDLKTDLSVYRPSSGFWHLNNSTTGFSAQQFGVSTDKPAAADYDGDGKTDIAVWREANLAYFYILQSATNTVRAEQFGQTGDVLTINDWDGDGKADASVYRDSAIGSQSFFYYRGSLNNPGGAITFVPWGQTGDKAVRGDFDGDGKADATIFRPSNAFWFVRQSSNGQMRSQQWGLATDRRVTADFDGDGKTDFAVFRPSDGFWYVLNSNTGNASYRQWGLNTDTLIPGDFNGDGRTEVSVYRPNENNWYTPQCADFKQPAIKFGASGDVAIPSSLIP